MDMPIDPIYFIYLCIASVSLTLVIGLFLVYNSKIQEEYIKSPIQNDITGFLTPPHIISLRKSKNQE